VRRVCPDGGPDATLLALGPASEAAFAVSRLVLQQRAADIPVRSSDEDKLAELCRAGWQWHEAATWGESDCLADSLLQLLGLHELIALPSSERRPACVAARQHLLQSPDLLPRDPYGRPQWDAYLQHHRHAEALVLFFLQRFPAGPVQLSRAGISLVVHARYDTATVPSERLGICASGDRASGPALEMHMFNWTGAGLQGYHYDVLFRPRARAEAAPVVVDVDAVEEGPARAAPSRLKRGRNDGKGRAPQQSAPSQEAASPSSGREQAQGSASMTSAGLGTTEISRPKAKAKGKQARAGHRATGVVVSGFGDERCADVDAQRQQLDQQALRRASARRDSGQRGRARDVQDRDLDRSSGGAWHAGR